MTCQLNTLNILMLDVTHAKEMVSKKTYTLTIVILVNMIYALIVKSTNTKLWKIKKLKLKSIFKEFIVIMVINWIKYKVMKLNIKYNVMYVQP